MSRNSILSVEEAAAQLSLNPSRVRALIVEGRIPAKRISHGYALLRSDVERFAARPRSVGRPPT